MQIKDLSANVRLEEVRGGRGADVHQSIYNGPTTGLSLAFGSGVNSPTSSYSEVVSAHTNKQDASAISSRKREISALVKGSQNVFVALPSLRPSWI